MGEIQLHYTIAIKQNGIAKSQQLDNYMDEYDIGIDEIEDCSNLFWLADVSSETNSSEDPEWELRAKTNINLCAQYNAGECDEGCQKLHICKHFLISQRFCLSECPFGLSHNILDHHNWSVLLHSEELRHFNETELRKSRMVMSLIRASFPRLCDSFRKSGFCLKIFCGYLHICPDIIYGSCRGRCVKWNEGQYDKGYYHNWASEHNQDVLNIFNLSYLKQDREELIGNLLFRGGDQQPQHQLQQQSQQSQQQPQSQPQLEQENMAIPQYWPKITAAGELIRIPSRKFNTLKRQFLRSMGETKVRVKTIQEVCNAEFFEKYVAKKRNMQRKLGENFEELNLYHGTEHNIVASICAQNFDWRLCGKNATVYGHGSYFSSDASYSHMYTTMGSESTRYMFLADVLVGQFAKGSSNLKRPPPVSTNSLELYDSCVNDINNPTIFVVFERDQCYPRYLISYTVVEKAKPAPQRVASSFQAKSVSHTLPGQRSAPVTSTSRTQTSLTQASGRSAGVLSSFQTHGPSNVSSPCNHSGVVPSASQSQTSLAQTSGRSAKVLSSFQTHGPSHANSRGNSSGADNSTSGIIALPPTITTGKPSYAAINTIVDIPASQNQTSPSRSISGRSVCSCVII